MTVWEMTDNEYFAQLLIKVIAGVVIVVLGIIAYVKERRK
jgi:hypothetical protein